MFKPVSSQPDFNLQEEEILSFWQENKIFEKSVEKNKGKEKYIVLDGPPTANALPPLHTMAPMSFKDLVGRYKTMRGYHVPRQAGWDTHGLPVEVQVEKAMGLSSKKDILNLVPGDESASIQKFNDACRKSVWEYKQEWDKFVPRVGYWTDVKDPYITYDPKYIETVWGVFKQIWEKNLVYKSHKVVPYCPRCGTALSAGEVAQGYQDIHDTSVFVGFPLAEQPQRQLLAWTTTPWTLPGNVALAVGLEMEYVVIRLAETKAEYILAKERLSVIKQEHEILETMQGKDLVGLKYLPLYNVKYTGSETNQYLHTVVSADFVSTEDGSGIVHLAVMYGEDDYTVGKQYDLPMEHTVGLDGVYTSLVPELEGKYIRDVQDEIIAFLKSSGRLYAKQSITHSYPFCWRCKTALIYYAKDSWFISMSQKRKELVAANDKIQWFPSHIKDGRFGDFIREARDWAISRERFWGTPLPIWISKTGKMICVGSYKELGELSKTKLKIDADFDPHRPMVDNIVLVKDGEEYYREPLVMDVWFDSGSMPYASGREARQEYPGDYICEAIDQTRGWFNTLLSISVLIKGEASYKRVTCIGHLVDEHGKKMSKSLGNIFNPWELFKVCGVDAIRWFLYTVNSPGEAKSLSVRELQTKFRKSILLLWNVFNYYVTYANLNKFSAPLVEKMAKVEKEAQNPLDQWIYAKQIETLQKVTEYIEEYDFMRSGRLLEEYINEVSTWYLRRSRNRNDEDFFVTMYAVLMNIAKMMAPFTPYISESIYQVLKADSDIESVHLTDWPVMDQKADQKILKEMASLRSAVETGLSIRAAEGKKVRQPLQKAELYFEDPTINQYFEKNPAMLEIISDELNVLECAIVKEISPDLVQKDGDNLKVGLDLTISDQLANMGLARELLRQIQQQRKQLGLEPGEKVEIRFNMDDKDFIEQLLNADRELLEKAFLILDPKKGWDGGGETEITLDNQSIIINLLKSSK